jgi:Putative phage metallopeptidase
MSEVVESLDLDAGAYQVSLAGVLHPAVIADQLLKSLPEFVDLVDGEATIDWLFKRDEKIRGGRQILGAVHMPKVPGELNPCFGWMLERVFGRKPDFLVILDRNYWLEPSETHAAIPHLREILVYHELTHCIHQVDREGGKRYDHDERPIWGLRGHDVEEFTAVARRYGAWNTELESFCAAVEAHAAEARLTSQPATRARR